MGFSLSLAGALLCAESLVSLFLLSYIINMPKVGSSNRLFAHHVTKFLWQFPDLKYDGSQIVCLVCNQNLLCWNRSLCRRHINSEKHKFKKSGHRPYTEFVFDLIFMLSACNVPFYILNKEPFRHFWKKYNPTWKLPGRTTLQRQLPYVLERLESDIKSQIHDKELWLAIDETIDSKKHSIANVIIRVLDPLGSSSPYLLASKRLERCDSEAIQDLILTTLYKFEISTRQILMFVTDSVPSMLVAGHCLKSVYPNLIHITCVLDALRCVIETIQKCYRDVDALIVNTKMIFHKSPKRVRQFHKQCPGISKSPQQIFTQWETWLEAAFYYLQNFQKIKSLVLQFDAKESAAIRESQIQFQSAQIETDLKTIHNNYTEISRAIKKFQNTSLSLEESLQIVDDVQRVLQTLNDEKGIHIREKFDSLLRHNPEFNRLRCIYSNTADTDPLIQFRDHFKYANITTLDAKRSLSVCNDIFASKRTALKETTVETYAMLQMFSRAHPDF